MDKKYDDWKMPVPQTSTYKWTEEDWERYMEKSGICPKCIEDAKNEEVESFYAQYIPPPGTMFKITKGVSEMEKDLMAKRPNEIYTFMELDRTHGYYICADKIGARWCLHPEALQEATAAPTQ